MAQLFQDQCRDAWKESHSWGLLKLWLHIVPDLLRTSIAERFAALTNRQSFAANLVALVEPRKAFRSVFLGVFLLTAGATALITFLLPETYGSTARLTVKPDDTGGGPLASDPYFTQAAFETMESRLILAPVIARLNLGERWGKKYSKGETLGTEACLKILRDRLSLKPVRNTSLVAVTCYSDDKMEAAQIANAVVESYQSYRTRIHHESIVNVLALDQRAYREQNQQIQRAQAELASLRQQLKIENEPVAGQSEPAQSYSGKQRELDDLLKRHKLLAAKIEADRLNLQISETPSVLIIDPAAPGSAPMRPNKALDIVLGTFLGILAATGLGAIAALAAFQIRRRLGKPGATA